MPAALSACLAALPFSPTSPLIPLPLTFWVFPATSERSVNVDKYYCEEVMAKYSLHHLYALVGERFFISYTICYFSMWQFCKMRKENWRAEEPTLCSCCSHTPCTGTRRLLASDAFGGAHMNLVLTLCLSPCASPCFPSDCFSLLCSAQAHLCRVNPLSHPPLIFHLTVFRVFQCNWSQHITHNHHPSPLTPIRAHTPAK